MFDFPFFILHSWFHLFIIICKYGVSCLLVGPWTYGRYVFLPNVQLINCRLHLFRTSASFFSSKYLLFLKSSRSCVLLLPTPFTFVICLPIASRRTQFLLRKWPIQLGFLSRILYRRFPLLSYSLRTCSLVTFSEHFTFPVLLQHRIDIK